MTYYHLCYNVYEQPGFPVKKETWINLDEPIDDSGIRKQLETEHQNKVSVIFRKEICLEEFEQIHSTPA